MTDAGTEDRRNSAGDRRNSTVDRRQFVDISWPRDKERRVGGSDRREGMEDRRE